jgi:hypothetical protein
MRRETGPKSKSLSRSKTTKPSEEENMLLLTSLLAIPASIYKLSGFQLLVAGGLLLCAAALLLAISRERRVSIKRSLVTDELAVHTGRIADALERIAAQTKRRTATEDSRWPQKAEPEKADNEAHRIAYSIFGR